MKKIALAWLGVLLVLALPAVAQKNKQKEDVNVRSVSGQVTDDAGKAVSGAVVHLKNTKTLQIRSYITKDDGSYSFHGLNTNVDYELKAEREGASSGAKTLSVFDSRNNAVINLTLNKK